MSGKTYLLYDHDQQVALAVGAMLGEYPWDKFTAIGFLRGNRIVGGVVYHNMRGYGIETSIAASDPGWCNRRVLHGIFHYPFDQLQMKVIISVCAKKNRNARQFVERLGFKRVGPIPDAYGSDDAMLYAIRRADCRWIEECPDNRQKIA